MSDQSEIPTADAIEVFVASLRQRSVPVNTIKSYTHDLHLFVRVLGKTHGMRNEMLTGSGQR